MTEIKRIVKDYDERKTEFLKATGQFFYTVGYEKMSVQMLIDKVGVAKGTFYHYFKSKEDLLTQWVFQIMDQMIVQNEEIVQDGKLDAITKLNKIFQLGRDWKLKNIDIILSLLKVVHDDHNIRLRAEMAKQSAIMSKEILEKVIQQGVSEGVFNPAFPQDYSQVLPRIVQLFSEDFGNMILGRTDSVALSITEAHRMVSIWQDIIERILGAPRGSLIFVDEQFINAIIDHITKNKQKK